MKAIAGAMKWLRRSPKSIQIRVILANDNAKCEAARPEVSEILGTCKHSMDLGRDASGDQKPLAFLSMGDRHPRSIPKAARSRKFIIVAVDHFSKWVEAKAVDHFSKWVEAEAVQSITTKQAISFIKKNIFTRFRIPKVVITNNGTQLRVLNLKTSTGNGRLT